MDSSLTFSDQEIQDELSRLGYDNIPSDRLRQFQEDLNQLVLAERSRATSHSNSFGSDKEDIPRPVHRDKGDIKELVNDPEDVPRDMHAAEEDLSRPWKYMSEDDTRHIQAQDLKSKRPGVPGTFSLFELPRRDLNLRDDVSDFRDLNKRDDESDVRDLNLRDDVSETDSEIRRMKRKTLRKNEEGAKFIDESMSDIDTSMVITSPHQRMVLRDLDPVVPKRVQSARSRDLAPYRLDPDDPRPASVIYSSTDHPHTRNLRRADPVARFQQMQQSWAAHKAPGETKHNSLRWNVREHMLSQFVPEKKPQRKYVPNDYIPPTDKQRKALRWKIRMDMA